MAYILQSNRLAQHRLQLQHQLYKKSSENLLLEAGLKPGMKVMEVGCGIGLMTEFLAETVTNKGSVLSFDFDPDYVEITSKRVGHEHQVFIYEKNVYDVKDFGQQFDLIYCRMVLHHLQQPEKAIEALVSCLKPGAVLVIEEVPSMDGVFAYPESTALKQEIDLVLQTFKNNDIKYEIAYTMTDYLKSLPCEVELCQLFQPVCLTEDQKMIHAMGLEDIGPKIVSSGLATEDEIAALIVALKQELPSRKMLSLFKMVQVIARA